jgi:plastocyanin
MSLTGAVSEDRRRRTAAAWMLAAVIAASVPALALAAGGTIGGKVEATPPKYLAETVVYLEKAPGSHAAATVAMDQKGMKFVPHLLAITAGDTVEFLNHDAVAHNVYSPDNEGYNLGSFKPGEKRSYAFKSPGVYTQLCSVHPEMLGFIFVGQNPFAAAVDSEGRFTLKDVPPGTYQIAVWNSHLKAPAQSVTVVEGKTAKADFALRR